MNPNDIFGPSPSNDGAVTLEELESAFGRPTQRQDYYETPVPGAGDAMPGDLIAPDGPDPEPLPMEEAPSELSPDKARRTGERIARLVDTGIDFALSNFVARNDESYRADERDLEDIADCWGEIAQEHDWNIKPEWQLAILYIMVYGPLVKQAITDRRLSQLEERQRILEERMSEVEKTRDHGNSAAAGIARDNANPEG